jgi:uncharacterized protein (DUF2235 family)
MPKNIVICCDGTGNEYGPENSNVVKLFQILSREPRTQVAFYGSGVGTMAAPEALSTFMKKATWICGLAFGYGLQRNVSDAYAYLMEHYEEGDQVFLFGFSRGSYTARALAGLLHKCGLLERGANNQISYAYRIFQNPVNFEIAGGFKKTFSRPCRPRFLGVWDTVSTIGWIYNPVTLPYTARNPDISVIRHAISIDERRTHFRTNLFFPDANQDCKQVWFSGVHCDVGGGYPENESGLSKIPLKWMTDEAVAAGLLVDPTRYDLIVRGNDPSGKRVPPDVRAPIHQSLHGFWRLVEHLPRRYMNMHSSPPALHWTWAPFSGFYRPRFIAENVALHASVRDRMAALPDYRPVNLPKQYAIES